MLNVFHRSLFPVLINFHHPDVKFSISPSSDLFGGIKKFSVNVGSSSYLDTQS